jgi:hypothetical protein
MTALSALFPAGGAGVPYPSGVPILGPVPDALAAANVANTDYLLPFVPRSDVTIDALWWYRYDATASNIYMGLIDSSGNRLDDCSVDSDTTVGLHEISSTDFDLTAGSWYGIIINGSSSVIGGEPSANRTDNVTAQQAAYVSANPPPLSLFSGGTFPLTADRWVHPIKSRTNAAVPDPVTMSGFSGGTDHLLFGAVPA